VRPVFYHYVRTGRRSDVRQNGPLERGAASSHNQRIVSRIRRKKNSILPPTNKKYQNKRNSNMKGATEARTPVTLDAAAHSSMIEFRKLKCNKI